MREQPEELRDRQGKAGKGDEPQVGDASEGDLHFEKETRKNPACADEKEANPGQRGLVEKENENEKLIQEGSD